MKRYLLLLPLLALTACDINKHQYHVEYTDGVTFDFTADQCGLYKDKQVLACNSDGKWMFSVRWDQVKHFHDLTQEAYDAEVKQRAQQQAEYQKNHKDDDDGSVVGTVLTLHILGII